MASRRVHGPSNGAPHIADLDRVVVGALAVEHRLDVLERDEVIARADGTELRIAHELSAGHQSFGCVARSGSERIQPNAPLDLACDARQVRSGPNPAPDNTLEERMRAEVEQRTEGCSWNRYIPPPVQKALRQTRDEVVLVAMECLELETGAHQTHAAIDVGADSGGDHEVRRGRDDAADRRDAPGMKVGGRARAAHGTIRAGNAHRRKGEKLMHGSLFERQRIGKEHARLRVGVPELEHALTALNGHTGAAQGFLQSDERSGHGCCR